MSKDFNQNDEPVVDENSIISERRNKLKELRELGVAFPNQFKPKNLSSELHQNYDGDDKETLESKGVEVSVSGRMMLKRVMGKASFATIQDNKGRIQLYVARDLVNSDANPELYSQFK
ncbi:MAG: lysine--tRNA ligase, partial [Nitrosomonadales bacterium]|nr:lysine--tRNA ligase [Nitrosomonadales bacterium]